MTLLISRPRTNLKAMESLSTKEQLLSGYFSSLPVQAFIQDLDGKLIYVNPKFAAAHCITCGNLKQGGFPNEDLFYDALIVAEKRRKFRVTKFPITDAEGATIAMGGLGHFQDEDVVSMTEKSSCNDCQMALHEEEKQEEPEEDSKLDGHPQATESELLPHGDNKLFANMPMGATYSEIITDEHDNPIDFRFLAINPAFLELTGLRESETVGRRLTEVLPQFRDDPTFSSPDGWIGQFGTVALHGGNWRFERKYFYGLNLWIGGVAYRPSGQTRRFVSLFLNLSQSVHAEEALRESEERHRNLFESMMQGVVYQGGSGEIIAANPSAERILGLTVDQMMGRKSVDPRWKSMKEDKSDFPGNEHPSMVALATGKPVTGVLMGVFHPSTDRHSWILIDAIPLFRPGEDRPYQVYATFTDLTQTKEFERKLLKEKARAEMADQLKSAFLANMSHEIRTPLNGIIGHIDLALSNGLCSKFREENLEGLNVARQSGELLISIIQDILDLSKIEAGQMDIHHGENFRLRELVSQVASLGQTMINQRTKSISFEHRVDGDIADCICGDPFRTQQVLNNLVSNAVKFTDTGKVELSIVLLDNQMLQFSVRDTGKGIPKDHLESIFEPFRQVEIGDTRKHGGTGLGLTISKKLVEMMGGELTVVSTVEGSNKGSCFGFTFPYKRHVAPPEEGILQTKSMLAGPEIGTRNERSVTEGKILVAEDERVSRRLVTRMLDILGYEVLLAEDGQQAVDCFKSRTDIALILMDCQMPNLDGLEATRLIRELESTEPDRPPTTIIALSAGAMKGDSERGLAVGMTAYLTKPVNFKLLQVTLEKYLGR